MSSDTDPLPPGMNSIAIINPNLQSVIIGQTFLTLLIPLLVALFFYSTPHTRRQPIFILNVFALIMAIAACAISQAMSIHLLLAPQSMWPAQIALLIAVGLLGNIQGMLADTILLVRLIAVHPLRHIGPMRFALITCLPIILKVVRGVNDVLFAIDMAAVANGPNAFQNILSNAWLAGPYMKIEWVAQTVDNAYASIAFLWTIRTFRSGTTTSLCANSHQSPMSKRLQILFNLALSNFVFPTVMSIIQVAVLCKYGDTNWILLNDITYVSSILTVFGVVFATVWAGKEQRRELDGPSVDCEQGRIHGAGEWRVQSGSSVIDTMKTEKHQSDATIHGASD